MANELRMSLPLAPVILDGRKIQLIPLEAAHHAALCAVGLDERLWQYTTIQVQTVDDMRRYVQLALDEQQAGTALPFIITDRPSGQIIGSTRFHTYQPSHRRVEIGRTWL